MGTALNVCLVYENLYVQKIKIRNIRIIPELRYNYYYYIAGEIGVRVYVLLLYNDCHVSHDCLYNVLQLLYTLFIQVIPWMILQNWGRPVHPF